MSAPAKNTVMNGWTIEPGTREGDSIGYTAKSWRDGREKAHMWSPTWEGIQRRLAEKSADGGERVKYFAGNGAEIVVGGRYWDNNLRVVTITELATSEQKNQNTGEAATWHAHTGGSSDSSRLTSTLDGKAAADYAEGTGWHAAIG